MRVKSPSQIYRVDGKNCFAEVLTSALGIDKVMINFIAYNVNNTKGNRETGHVSIYMDIFEAKVFAGDILSGRFATLGKREVKLAKEKTESPENKDGKKFYPGHVYQLLGGTSGKSTADHKPISRQFILTPGMAKPWVMDAMSGPGKTIGTGLIAPDGKPTTSIRIGLTNEQLKQFAYAIELSTTLWANAKFMPVIEPIMAEVRAQVQAAINEMSAKNGQVEMPEDICDNDMDCPDELPY